MRKNSKPNQKPPAKANKKAPEKEKTPISEGGIVGEILSKLPDDTPTEVIEQITELVAYSGPLPPSAMLRDYEETLPGIADRIMIMAEKEQDIRSRDNRHILNNNTFKIGGSFMVSIALVGAGVFCGVIGQPVLGAALGTSGAVAGIVRAVLNK